MKSSVSFERPTFEEITAAIERSFPSPGTPAITLTPASFDRYFEAGGIQLHWQPIPDWEDYEWGRREISDEEMLSLLFSPKVPELDEAILVVTDECFRERRGFRVRFGDLLAFARDDCPRLWQPRVHFFQPLDMIFLAGKSRLLTLLHHEGQWTQYAA